MVKFNYISILAGGICKFNCNFCVGKDIRKNEKPHFSSKWKAFIECFADMANLLSVSGDTSDPSFVDDVWKIARFAKYINKNIKVALHTRNIKVINNCFESGYDKFVLSIDENFNWQKHYETLLEHKDNVRISFVMTDDNFWILDEWYENYPQIFEDFQITIRPEVHLAKNENWNYVFKERFEGIGQKTFNEKNVIELENGALQNKAFPKLWYWDYNKTNPKLNVRYLFSDGNIASNCQWEKII